jgi:hypothetical protein
VLALVQEKEAADAAARAAVAAASLHRDRRALRDEFDAWKEKALQDAEATLKAYKAELRKKCICNLV